jgi:hypothetical protein
MAILLNWTVSKNGLINGHTTNAAGTANSVITSISGVPTFYVGGVQVSSENVYGPFWCDSAHDSPDVWFRITPALTSASVVTVTVPANCINTALGGNTLVSSPAPVLNSFGSLEPVYGEVTAWAAPSKCKAACNLDNGPWIVTQPQPHAANLALRMAWQTVGSGTVTFSSTDNSQVQSWSATSGLLFSYLSDYTGANGIDALGYPSMPGQYVISWVDANFGTGSESKCFLAASSTTAALTVTPSDGKPEPASATTYSGGVRTTMAGNRVVITYANVGYFSNPNAAGYNMNLRVVLGNASKQWAAGNTISGLIVVGPNDTLAAVLANPYAVNQNLKSVLMASNGNGPATIRAMNTVNGGVYGNIINYSTDCQHLTQASYATSRATISRNLTISSIRRYSTDPTNPVVSWSSTKFYDWSLAPDGTDAIGPYIDLTIRNATQHGLTDNGQHLNPYPSQGKTAAAELTIVAHGLRTGDTITFPGSGALYWPITGGATTALPTANVVNGSPSVTFATAVTVPAHTNQGVAFGDDSTGQAYLLGNSTGSPIVATTWTMFPAYQGTTAGASTCAMTAYANLSSATASVVVTDADHVAICCALCVFATAPSSGPIQQLSGTAAVPVTTPTPISLSVVSGNPYNLAVAPIAFYAALSAQVNCQEIQVPFQLNMTDACIDSIIDEFATVAPAGMRMAIELCDEAWNNTFPAFVPTQQWGNRAAFVANGAVPHTPATARALGLYEAYAANIAHKWDVAQARMDTYDRGYKVVRCIGVQFGDNVYAEQAVTYANTNSIAFDRAMTGAYVYCPSSSNTTWAEACATTGTNPGSLTVAEIADVARFYIKNSPTWWGYHSSNYNALQNYNVTTTKPIMTCYESAMQNNIPTWNGPLAFDGWYNQSFTDLFNAYGQSLEDGDPRVPGSGCQIANHYTHGSQRSNGTTGESQLWSLQVYQGQQPGDGSTNLMTTTQATGTGNGINNDINNNSPALAAWLAWIGAANTPAGGPMPSFTVFSTTLQQYATSPVILVLDGTATSWNSGSSVSVQNSVTGTTTAVAGTWTAITDTSATLGVTTGAGAGTFTVTIDGIVSPPLTVAVATIRVSPSRIPPGIVSPAAIKLTILGTGTNFGSGSSVSITNSITGTTYVAAVTWTEITAASATLTVTTGPGSGPGTGTYTVTIDSTVSGTLVVGPRKAGWFSGMGRLSRFARAG